MNSIGHLYTEFSSFQSERGMDAPLVDQAVQDARLEGFEAGYQAGWDDAVKARSDEGDRLTDDFVQTVQDFSFTYHEAYSKLSDSMQPLMTRFVTSVMPEVAKDGLYVQLADQIKNLVDTQSENAIAIAVSPQRKELISQILRNKVGVPFAIEEEPSLSNGQFYLRVSQQEREIDIDSVVEEVRNSINAFFQSSSKEVGYG